MQPALLALEGIAQALRGAEPEASRTGQWKPLAAVAPRVASPTLILFNRFKVPPKLLAVSAVKQEVSAILRTPTHSSSMSIPDGLHTAITKGSFTSTNPSQCWMSRRKCNHLIGTINDVNSREETPARADGQPIAHLVTKNWQYPGGFGAYPISKSAQWRVIRSFVTTFSTSNQSRLMIPATRHIASSSGERGAKPNRSRTTGT
jgi:hypothetical protein